MNTQTTDTRQCKCCKITKPLTRYSENRRKCRECIEKSKRPTRRCCICLTIKNYDDFDFNQRICKDCKKQGKRCSICHEFKQKEAFSGKQSACKFCDNTIAVKKYKKQLLNSKRKCVFCKEDKNINEFNIEVKKGHRICHICSQIVKDLEEKGLRKCNSCNEIKEIKDFFKNQKYVDKNCKSCRKLLRGSPEEQLLRSAKFRSKKLNLEFTITIDDCIIPEFCPILGIKLEQSNDGGPNNGSPTLDRVNPKLGYIKGNVRVISWKANRLKSNGTAEEFRNIVRYIEENTLDLNPKNI